MENTAAASTEGDASALLHVVRARFRLGAAISSCVRGPGRMEGERIAVLWLKLMFMPSKC